MNEETALEIMALQRAQNTLLKLRRQWNEFPKLQEQFDKGILHVTIRIYDLKHPEKTE
jgi:hypothetical protein